MNKRRLLKLADFLETVPPTKFSLRTWVQSMPTQPESETEGSCGFAGCAMGWAVHAKLFRGLRFATSAEADEVHNPEPVYKGKIGFPAVNVLFDIDTDDSHRLFAAPRYNEPHTTPKQVAKRIREFCGAKP